MLIISNEHDEHAQNVINWIDSFGCVSERLTYHEFISTKTLHFAIPNSSPYYSYYSIWFRRSSPRISNLVNDAKVLDANSKIELIKLLFIEETILVKNFLQNFASVKQLSDPNSIFIDKIDVLKRAIALGIKIPKTIISNSKKEIQLFRNIYREIIIKPLSDSLLLKLGKSSYFQHVKTLNEEEIEQLPNFFSPSIVQEYVEKIFEIRTFYFLGETFSISIFSKERDYRTAYEENNYSYFELPKEMENKIKSLMDSYELNFATIDFILNENDEYVLLEINFNGNYSIIEKYGRFGIDEKIARFLCF